jgi:hypothetical protein
VAITNGREIGANVEARRAELRVGERAASEQEERCLHALALERIEHAAGGAGFRPVIEGSHQLSGCQRQVCEKCLRPTRGRVAASTATTRAVPSARRQLAEGRTVAHHIFSHPLLDRMPLAAAEAVEMAVRWRFHATVSRPSQVRQNVAETAD